VNPATVLSLLAALTYPAPAHSARHFRLGVRDAFCWGQVPFGPPLFSLQPLRLAVAPALFGTSPYIRAVRLPMSVRHRRTSLDFPMRPKATVLPWANLWISRFPRARCVLYVLGVSEPRGTPLHLAIIAAAPRMGAFRFSLLQRRRPEVSVLRG